MSESDQDHYEVLGVSPGSSREEITIAFRTAVKGCHPDRFPGDPEKESLMKALVRAKSVLLDEGARRVYDAFRAGPPELPDKRAEQRVAERAALARAAAPPKAAPAKEPERPKRRTKKAAPAPAPPPKPAPPPPKPAPPPPPKPAPPPQKPARRTKSGRRSRRTTTWLVIELLGRRGYARKLWRPTVLRLFRESLKAENPRRRVPVVRIASYVVEQPGLMKVQFSYRRGQQRIVTQPHQVKLTRES